MDLMTKVELGTGVERLNCNDKVGRMCRSLLLCLCGSRRVSTKAGRGRGRGPPLRSRSASAFVGPLIAATLELARIFGNAVI